MLVSLGEVVNGTGDNGVSYIISIEKKEKMREWEKKKKKEKKCGFSLSARWRVLGHMWIMLRTYVI